MRLVGMPLTLRGVCVAAEFNRPAATTPAFFYYHVCCRISAVGALNLNGSDTNEWRRYICQRQHLELTACASDAVDRFSTLQSRRLPVVDNADHTECPETLPAPPHRLRISEKNSA